MASALEPSLREMHEMHHLGVDRSLYLARKVDPAVTIGSQFRG